jgi:GNAT superfamily N-acetyltransferase
MLSPASIKRLRALFSHLHSVQLGSFSIRRATPADAAGILSCLRAAFQPFENEYTPLAFADTVLTTETLNQRFTFMSIFVGVSQSAGIVGTIGCNATEHGEGHLRGMAVLSPWQGTGLADGLLQSAESELRSLGCRRVTLDTTAPLQRAIHFYEKCGYRATGKVFDFFGMPLYQCAKPLGGQPARL